MTDGNASSLLHYLRRLTGASVPGGTEDAQCLRRFVEGDEAAFAALLRRHGPMVLGVCRRVLRDPHDAEDAFQAAFLVLARKAGSVDRPELLGSWLYGVACRTALKLRSTVLSRSVRQIPLECDPPAPATEEGVDPDLRPLLDEEVNRLPDKYRVPIVLCYLEGLTNEQAAEQLGCPKGTILSRLSRARDLLRTRLTRRGVTVSTAGALGGPQMVQAVPATLAEATVAGAVRFVAPRAASLGPIVSLAEGVLKAMSLAKLKSVLLVVLVLTVLGSGMGAVALRAWSADPQGKREPAVADRDKKAEGNRSKVAQEPASAVDEEEQRRRDREAERARTRKNLPPGLVLEQTTDFEGLDQLNLHDVLGYLSERLGITVDINHRAFADAGVKDPYETLLKAVPSMKNVRLSVILRMVLSRVPIEDGATFLVRDGHIEVTTNAAVRAELGLAKGERLLPLVQSEFDKIPLEQALKEMARATGMNIVLDVRSADKAKLAISASFINVPVDAAVKVLADMAELRPVMLGNVLYVTSAENAERLKK
jgi:RNA polymerase sigma factor (sigma-70 family)